MPRYFAYGSNMNPERMAGRGLKVVNAKAGYLEGFKLCFNKQSRYCAEEARANIGYDPSGRVEGVVYELASASEIYKLDPHEGTPLYYSRERFSVMTETGLVSAWVYVANPAVIAEHVLPPRWYLEHLLAGVDYLSVSYLSALEKTACLEISGSVDIG